MDVPQKLETSENNVDVTTSKTIDSDINDDAHSVISASSSESSDDPTKYEVDSIASSVEERLTWRGRMQVIVHGHYFHLIIVLLVVLDAMIVLFELLLDVGAFNNIECEGEDLEEQAELCHYSRESRDYCAAPVKVVPINQNGSHLCTCKFRGGKRVCRDFRSDEGVNPGLVLHGFSLAILCIFLIEIIVKLIAFRLKFFTHKFEVFDAIIVVESFILDIASLNAEANFEAFNLLIILRLWRVIRIVNGAILSAKAQSDAQLAQVRGEARKTIHILHKLQAQYTQEMNEKDRVKKILEDHKIDPVTGTKPGENSKL
ncbi:voltage-gated hydrogen channel 1-like [Dysidea avara]|uniref:voltage-gated hydrogen channel 1-like n=1 Tax=Dysidea avara TaxID=196820 RepID=UPI003317DABE